MASATSVMINIGASTAGAVRGISQVNTALGQQMSIAQKTGMGIKKAMVPATAALAGLAGAGMVAVNAASDQEQAFGALASVFKKGAGPMQEWAENQSKIGLSSAEAANAAVLLGAQLKNSGDSASEAAAKSQKLVGLGADLAATFGGSTADAVGAVSAALKGEFDSLEKYGVSLSASKVEAEAMRMGLAKTAKALTAQDKMLATQSLLWKQTADAQGQATRESDSYAGTVASLKSEFTNLAGQLGTALLPVMQQVGDALAKFADWAKNNQGTVTAIAVVVGVLATSIIALNVAMSVWSAVTAIWSAVTAVATAVGTAFSTMMLILTAPITWVVLAIVALIAIVVLLWKNWDTVTKALGAAWDWIWAKAVAVFGALGAFFSGVWNGVKNVVVTVWNGIKAFLSGVLAAIRAVITTYVNAWRTIISTALNVIKTIFSTAWNGIRSGVVTAFNLIKSAVSNGIGNVLDLVRSLPGKILSALGNFGTLLYDKGRSLISGLIDGIKSMAGSILNAIRNLIPGPLRRFVPGLSSLSMSGPSVAGMSAPVTTSTVVINWYGGAASDARIVKRLLEADDMRFGRKRGAPLAIAW